MNHSSIVLLAVFFGFILFCVAESEIGDEHCQCAKRDCGCCTNVRVKRIVDGNVCANFSYLPEQFAISVTLTYNDKTILNDTISAQNPPPVCVVHVDQLHMNICVRFYDLAVKDRRFSGCSALEVSFSRFIPSQKIKLGCFSLDTQQPLSTEIQSAFNDSFDYLKGHQSKHNEVEPKVVSI